MLNLNGAIRKSVASIHVVADVELALTHWVILDLGQFCARTSSFGCVEIAGSGGGEQVYNDSPVFGIPE